MGSQYIRDTTDLKQVRKGIIIRFWGVYRYFTLVYADLLGICKRKWQVFNKVFHIFHNGIGGWIKVGRNGGKWRGNNGIGA